MQAPWMAMRPGGGLRAIVAVRGGAPLHRQVEHLHVQLVEPRA